MQVVRVKLSRLGQWQYKYGVDLSDTAGTIMHVDFDSNGKADPMVFIFLDRPFWVDGGSRFISHIWAPITLCYAESADYEGCLNER